MARLLLADDEWDLIADVFPDPAPAAARPKSGDFGYVLDYPAAPYASAFDSSAWGSLAGGWNLGALASW
jgi:hypothetical protein